MGEQSEPSVILIECFGSDTLKDLRTKRSLGTHPDYESDKGWGGWDFFGLQEFYFAFTASAGNFYGVKSPVRIFYFFLARRRGGGEGTWIFYSRNLNLDTRHNLITWERLQTNIFFIFYTVVLLCCPNYTPGKTQPSIRHI